MTIVVSVMNHLGTLIKIQWLHMCTLLCPLTWVSLLSLSPFTKTTLGFSERVICCRKTKAVHPPLLPFSKIALAPPVPLFSYLIFSICFKNLFIYLLAVLGLCSVCRFFLFAAREGYPLVVLRLGFPTQRLLSLQGTGSGHACFSCHGVWPQYLWCMGFIALQHVESSQTRDWTCGKWILNHWATREVLASVF